MFVRFTVLDWSWKRLAVSAFCRNRQHLHFPPKQCGNSGYRGGETTRYRI